MRWCVFSSQNVRWWWYLRDMKNKLLRLLPTTQLLTRLLLSNLRNLSESQKGEVAYITPNPLLVRGARTSQAGQPRSEARALATRSGVTEVVLDVHVSDC